MAASCPDKTIVVFESLTYQEKEIAVHADIEDHEQSIYFPGIGTTAKDKADGDQEAVATKEVTIIDTVSYQNLIPDTPYKTGRHTDGQNNPKGSYD